MKNWIILSFGVMLSGCLIMIGENGYRSLTESNKRYIKEYKSAESIKSIDTDSVKFLYEISADDILGFARKESYTWVHLWHPFCSNDDCINIGVFQDVSEKYDSLSFLMVSESYDFRTIAETANRSNYSWPIYVLKDDEYGHKLRKGRDKFAEDFNHPGGRAFGDDLIFRKDSVVYIGDDGIEFIDSLMSAKALLLK